MKTPILQYNTLVETALRSVVRQALTEVAQHGLPGKHHFYITFRTAYPGVQLPDYLKTRYPAEMTIVLQYQFYDLEVTDTAFGVTLTFNNAPERLIIPLRAITVFADPSVQFALPFQPPDPPVEELAAKPAPLAKFGKDAAPPKPAPVAEARPAEPAQASTGDKADAAEKSAEVVSLDKFRKK
jgi:hypothetical protein